MNAERTILPCTHYAVSLPANDAQNIVYRICETDRCLNGVPQPNGLLNFTSQLHYAWLARRGGLICWRDLMHLKLSPQDPPRSLFLRLSPTTGAGKPF